MMKKRRKHVFLFRHCVRSTDSYVNLHNNDTTTTNNNNNNSNNEKNNNNNKKKNEIYVPQFWSSSLSQSEVQIPNWNVPTFWCTQQGMQQMHATGIYIYNTILKQQQQQQQQTSSSSQNNNTKMDTDGTNDVQRNIKFRFISDASQRDVDTTYALQQGISHAMLDDDDDDNNNNNNNSSTTTTTTTTFSSLVSSNIHVTEVLPNLFKPFQSTTISNNVMCTNPISIEQWQQEVQNRMQNIVPQPTTSITDVLHLLQVVLTDDNNTTTTGVVIDPIKNEPVLSGMINLIKLVAQMIFYSRASGIGGGGGGGGGSPPSTTTTTFLYRITNEQLYTILLPYIYYTRSVLNVGTTEAAIRGALLVRTMIDAIQFHNQQSLDSGNSHTMNDDDDYDYDTATFIVGHDTDLDAVATAMGVSWQFHIVPPQYNTNNTNTDAADTTINTTMNYNHSLLWYMTPPGSAIYLCHETEIGEDNDNDNNNNKNEVDDNSVVTMSYFVPIYDLESLDGSIISWQLVPLHLTNPSSTFAKDKNNNNDEEDTTTSSSHSSNGATTTTTTTNISMNENYTSVRWMYLQQHIQSTLQLYNGATECYYNNNIAGTIINHDVDNHDTNIPNTNNDIAEKQSITTLSSFGSGFGCGMGVSILLAVLLWYLFLYRNFKQQRLRSQYTSTSTSSLQLSTYNRQDSVDNIDTDQRQHDGII